MPEPTATPPPAAAPAAKPDAASTPVSPTTTLSWSDDIDALDKQEATPPKAPGGKEAPASKQASSEKEAVASNAGKESTSPEKATSDTSGSAKDAGAKKDTDRQPPVKAAELRAAYDKLKSDHHALKAEHEKLKSTATAKPAEDPEKPKLVESLKEKDERIAKLEEQLRYSSFQSTEEYKTKYEKPVVEAYQSGRARTSNLKVVEVTDPETGEVKQPARKGTPDDFDAIMRITDDDDAAELANKLFGYKASLVLADRAHLQRVNSARMSAIEEYRATGAERDKKAMEESLKARDAQQKQSAELSAMFNKLNAEAVAARPEFFKPDDGDEKGDGLLKMGFALADFAFGALPPERLEELPASVKSKLVNGRLPAQEIVRLHSEMRTKAAGYGFLTHKYRQAQNRIKELETKLSEFEQSVPQGGTRRPSDGSTPKSIDQEIDELDTVKA